MTSSSRRIASPRRSPFRSRLTLTVGVTVFLTLVGTAGASALWTAPAAGISGTVASDTVGIQLSLDKPLAVTYNASTATTSSRLTVRNSGGATVPYTVTVPADRSALAQAIVVKVWSAASATDCAAVTPPTGASTGTWATFPTISGESLASGASAYWCVRTTLDRVVTATVGQSVSAAFTATGTLAGTNWTSSAVSAAAVQTAQDTEKPTVPTAPVASATTSTGTTLTWGASTDNVGVVAYDIYRGTTLVGTSTTLTFTDAGLAQLTAYSYTITARDAASNVSAASVATTVTTTATASPTAWYKIVNPNSGFCLDGNEANTTSGVALIVYGCHGGTNQSWKFQSDGTILARYAALLMRPSANDNVQLTTAGQTRQVWTLVATSTTGQYQIKNTATDLCLDVGNNPSAVDQVVQKTCSSTSLAQRFTLTEMG